MRNTLNKNRVNKPEKLFTLAKEKILFMSILFCFFGMQRTVAQEEIKRKTTTGIESWIVPAGVTAIEVRVWGAGGRGGTRNSGSNAYGGGGGGAFSSSVITVIPGNTYNIYVGVGSSNNSNAGEDSWFSPSTVGNAVVLAKGGSTVANDGQNGASGGQASSGIGTTKFNGGNGATRVSTTSGGGGGSSASFSGIGVNSLDNSGAIAPAEGGNGGSGRNATTGNGTQGDSPGGGGGGAVRTGGSATGGNGGNGQVVILALKSDVVLGQTVDNLTPLVGGNVAFSLTVTNKGPLAVTGVSVANVLPSGLTLVSATPSGGTTWTSPNWTIGNLAVDGSATLTIVAKVNPTGVYTNSATLTFAEPDRNLSNNQHSITLYPKIPTANLQITNEVDQVTPVVASTVNFTLTAYNGGPDHATNVAVNNLLPDGFTITGHTGGAGYDSGTGIWTIGALNKGTTTTLIITATVQTSGAYLSTATISGNETDPFMDNNTSQVLVSPSYLETTIVLPFSVTTYDLSSYAVNNLPAGSASSWHTAAVATAANKYVGNLAAMPEGTYYLAFYDSTQNCYSLTTKIIIKKTAGSLFITNPMIYQRVIKN